MQALTGITSRLDRVQSFLDDKIADTPLADLNDDDAAQRKSRLRINAFLSGRFVDDLEGVRFGHAAVIVERGRGSVEGKKKALEKAGVFVADRFDDLLEGLSG